MKIKSIQTWIFSAVISASFTLTGQGILPQGNTEETPQEVTDTARIKLLLVTQITEAFTASNSLITEAGKRHYSEKAIALYEEQVDTLFSSINHFMDDSTVIAKNGISVRELDVITQQAGFYLGELKQLQKSLSDETVELNGEIQLLGTNIQEWNRTLANVLEEEITMERMNRINRTMQRLDSVRELLQGDLSKILEQEDRLTDKMNEIEQLQVWIMDQRALISERFFSRELPGLFSSELGSGDTALVQKHLAQIRKSFKTDMEILKMNFRIQMVTAALFLVLFMGFALWFRQNYPRLISKKYKLSDTIKALIHAPVVTVLFIVGLLIRFTLPHLPHTFRSLNLMIMMIPMIIIVIRFFGARIRNWILLLSILCGLTFFYDLTYNPDILLRIIILFFSISGLGLFLWIIIRNPFSEKYSKRFIY